MEKGRVLLLDDDKDILETCSVVFTTHDFDVSAFHDPGQALQTLTSGQLSDVIITDFRMPDMNGLQFLEELQRAGIQIPVIMFTGVADKALAIKALNAGCYSLLEKPVLNQELLHYAEQAIAYGRWQSMSRRLLQECQALIGLLRNLNAAYEARFTQAENIIHQNKSGNQPKPSDMHGYLKNIAQGISIETEVQNATDLVEALTREHIELQSRVRRC
jgi:FixJ family two-component response regulator